LKLHFSDSQLVSTFHQTAFLFAAFHQTAFTDCYLLFVRCFLPKLKLSSFEVQALIGVQLLLFKPAKFNCY
jgi:hypothetical protein